MDIPAAVSSRRAGSLVNNQAGDVIGFVSVYSADAGPANARLISPHE